MVDFSVILGRKKSTAVFFGYLRATNACYVLLYYVGQHGTRTCCSQAVLRSFNLLTSSSFLRIFLAFHHSRAMLQRWSIPQTDRPNKFPVATTQLIKHRCHGRSQPTSSKRLLRTSYVDSDPTLIDLEMRREIDFATRDA